MTTVNVEASAMIVSWQSVEKAMPPAHTKLLFLDDQDKIWQGDMCYGMHLPWFCVHGPDGNTFVLGDYGRRVTHWARRENAK